MMKKNIAALLCAVAATTAVPATALAETPNTTAYWQDKTTSIKDVTFPLNAGDKAKNINWALAYSDDPGYINIVAVNNPETAKKPQKLADLTKKSNNLDKPALATTPNGKTVAVIPTTTPKATTNGIHIDEVKARIDANISQDPEKPHTVPVAPPTDSLHLLYEITTKAGKKETSGADMNKSLTPEVSAGNTTISYDSNKKNDNDPQPSDGSLIPLQPGSSNDLIFSRYINSNEEVTSIIRALVPTQNDKDNDKDGLAPLDGFNPVKKTTNGAENVQSNVHLDVPKNVEEVYLHNEVVDKNGKEVTTPSMSTAAVSKINIDAQASTENKNAQLKPNAKQKIWNQVLLDNLMPGKPYNVVSNLYQCGDGNCTEVAAVNREIIPRASESLQNFAVKVDTSDMEDGDTFEWETHVYEGTGDFNNMGQKLADMADHNKNQVLSFSGSQKSQKVEEHAGEEKEFDSKPLPDDERNLGSPDVEDARDRKSADYNIVDEAPPANIGEVRENNKKLENKTSEQVSEDRAEAHEEDSVNWGQIGIAVGVVLAIAAAVALMSRRRNNGMYRA